MNTGEQFVEFLIRNGYFDHLVKASSVGSDFHGTVIFAVRYQNGVVMFGDRRATAGNFRKMDFVEKVFPIGKNAAFAIAGSLQLGLHIERILKISVKHHERTERRPLSIEAKARVATRIFDQFLSLPVQVATVGIIAGVDEKKGARIFETSVFAPIEYPNFVAHGAAAEVVYSTLQDHWPSDRLLSRAEVLALGSRAMQRAYEQNVSVGGLALGSTVYDITIGGIRKVSKQELEAGGGSHA